MNLIRTMTGGAAAAALLCAPGAAQAADVVYGLTDDNRIVRFNSDSPSRVLQTVPVQGLQAGETLVGIDVRPANDSLYVVGTSNRIYRVNEVTGATRVAFGDPFAPPALNGTSFGVDFNPVADALRIVSDADQNLRVPFGGGQAGRAQEDSQLQYNAGDANQGQNPAVGGAAYSNSFPGADTTALFDVDTARDVLVRQEPPNAGTLNTVGPLGIDADAQAGFDISPQGNVGFAALRTPGAARHALYRVDLTNGRATPAATKAEIGTNAVLRGIAVATGSVDDDRTRPEMSVAFSSTILEQNTNPLKPSISCDEACTITASARVEGRAAGSGTATLDDAGRVTVEIPLNLTAQRRIAREGTELIVLNVRAVDAAGNITEQNGRLSRTQTAAARRG
ncbi:MAG: DUF4394 domain-containing protein [Actinomycetota bacterium]|nr:DUF4394 domain-containing protein [Actinomycetota bacterium]MDQ5808795.1 DUF4394 domain-containing protein [Actinomycetota bacterium]